MSSRVVVLRPEPGNSATCARLTAAGWDAISLPLFAITALDWTPPPADAFDALILTSTNTLRHAGPAIARYLALPVYAVGAATAAAAEAAGFTVALTGTDDAAGLVAAMATAKVQRALHLGGLETRVVVAPPVAASVAVYASQAWVVDRGRVAEAIAGASVLVHSPGAGARLAELAPPSARFASRLIAISAAAAVAAGEGWGALAVASMPNEAAMLAALAAD